MSAVNERLSKSKAEWSESRFNEGKAAGEAWAKDVAEYDELVKLKEFDSSSYSDFDSRDKAWEEAYGMLGDSCGTGHQFDEEVLGDKDADDHYAAGFIIGAQEYFESVEDDL